MIQKRPSIDPSQNRFGKTHSLSLKWCAMNRYLHGLVSYLSWLCLFIGGCTFTSDTPVIPPSRTILPPLLMVTGTSIPVDTISLTATKGTPTGTPQPSSTFTPTPAQLVLPAITMSSQEAENALQEFLRTTCTGKCVAGIRPDEMTVQEAVNIMTQWGMVKMTENSQGKVFIHLVQNPLYGQVYVKVSLGTWSQEFVTIDKLSVHISGPPGDLILGENWWLDNRDAWQAIRLDNLLNAYGVPTYVGYFFQTTVDRGIPMGHRTINYKMDIHYEKKNLVVGIGALAYKDGENIRMCPSIDPHDLGIEINPERSLKELEKFSPVTWQELTGTDLEAFYTMFTSENSFDTCVNTTLEQIMALQPEFR